MNLVELGSLLKRERERRGLSVRDVMDSTKISRRNLNALESGEVRFLPHPVYLKGYVRNYAKLVGLDYEPLVAVVDQQSDGDSGYIAQASPAVLAPELPVAPAAPDTPVTSGEVPASPAAEPLHDVGELPLPAPQPAPQSESRPKSAAATQPQTPAAAKSGSNLRSVIVLLLLVAALAGLLYQYQRVQSETPPPAPAPAAAPVADNATNATEQIPADNATAEPAAPAVAPAPASAPVAAPAPAPAPGTLAPAVAPAPSGSVPAASIEVSRKVQPAPEAFGSGQELLITAKPGELCWMELSDGQRSRSFILRNGESRKVEFGGKLRVRLGNSGGVTFRLNGEQYPFEGERGQKQVVEFGPR